MPLNRIRALTLATGVAVTISGATLFESAAPGGLSYQLALPLLGGGVALLVAIPAAGTPFWRAALLFILAVIGQAAALQLIVAPHYAVYQHYAPIRDLINTHALPLSIVTIQAIVCGVLGSRYRKQLWRLCQHLGWMLVVGTLAVLAFGAAVPTESLERYVGEAAIALSVSTVALANLALVAAALPSEALGVLCRAYDGWTASAAGMSFLRRADRALPWVVAGTAVVIAVAVTLTVFEAMPHIDDSVAYLFQAKTYATGSLFLDRPPDDAAFEMRHILIQDGKWFSKYFPGWPAILALGVVAGIPWLINPLIAGATILLLHAVLVRVYGRCYAHIGALLLVVSPWFLFMSSGFMGHPVTLAWALLAILAIERSRHQTTILWPIAAGVALGAIALTRPLEGVLLLPLLIAWAAMGPTPSVRPTRIVTVVVVALALTALVLPFNQLLTGHATLSPFKLWSDIHYGPGVDAMGFGSGIGIRDWPNLDPRPGHDLIDVVLNLNKNVFATNVELFGWVGGALILPLVGLFGRRWTRRDRLIIAWLGVIAVGHSAYWFSGGPDFGARYWYVALPVFIVTTVWGLEVLSTTLSHLGVQWSRVRVGVFAGSMAVVAIITFMPWRAWGKYYRYRDIGGQVERLVRSDVMDGSVVLVRSPVYADVQSGFNLNEIPLSEGGIIFAREAGPASQKMLQTKLAGRRIVVIGREDADSALRLFEP